MANEFDEYVSGQSCSYGLTFNVGKSIIKVRNGEFYLKPFIRMFIVGKQWEAIEGRITPWDAYAVVSVYNETDTAYAIPFRDGKLNAEV